MKKLFLAAALGLSVLVSAPPAFCADAATLYEDPETGQLFTKPAQGRTAVDIPAEKAAGLYEDAETGAVYSKPGEGRAPVAAAAVPVQEPPKKEEVMAVLPDWLQRTKLGGDFRLRYQFEDRPGTTATPRHRARYRLRVGVDSDVVKSLKVGFGLASGSADRRSTNQTFDNFFAKNDIRIDYAYAAFKPFETLTITGGRMKNPLYVPSDMLWDTDVNPLGGALNASYQTQMPVELSFNGAIFVLNEYSSNNKDPYMYVLQPAVKWDITNKASLKLAGSYYGFDDQDAIFPLPGDRGGNNTISGGRYVFDYDSFVLSGEMGVKDPVPGILPYAGVFGEFVHAFEPLNHTDEGWVAGVKLGSQKIAGLGDWSLRYTYRRLENDAFVDFLPDSDFFGGNTGVSGHEALLSVGLLKNTYLDLDYYRSRTIATNIDEDLFQVDLNFKF